MAISDYAVRLGPLKFTCAVDNVSETLGDGLDSVGAAVVATDRKPRPLKLKLPVRAAPVETDMAAVGQRMRRQVRQLAENSRWRLQGLYLTLEVDPDLDSWTLLGGCELSETDPGVVFGEFELELTDLYIAGRPGTHKMGRRAMIADRRSLLVPRDSRRLIFSTDYPSQALPAQPLFLPGDIADTVRSGNAAVTSTTGPLRGATRHLWRSVVAVDGDVFQYLPDSAVLTAPRTAPLDLDETGCVRVWNLSASTVYPPNPASYNGLGDAFPEGYGWERVLGDVLAINAPLAIENGLARVIFLGATGATALALEYFDEAAGKFARIGRLSMDVSTFTEQRVVELTPERGIVEFRKGTKALRVILQRGWLGPRVEAYDDAGGTAYIAYSPNGASATPVGTVGTPTNTYSVTATGATNGALLVAAGVANGTASGASIGSFGPYWAITRTRAIVAQVAPAALTTNAALAALSIVDARPVPVLVGHE